MVVVALLATAAVGMTFSALAAGDRPREPTLERVCWTREGAADRSGRGPCASRKAVPWPRRAISVRVEPEPAASSERAQGIVGAAVEWWNAQAGFELFRPALEVEVADVVVAWGVVRELDRDLAGACAHWLVAGAPRAKVFVRPSGSDVRDMVVAAHELGHAAGLDHDPEWAGGSIMLEGRLGDPDGDGLLEVGATRADLDALRASLMPYPDPMVIEARDLPAPE